MNERQKTATERCAAFLKRARVAAGLSQDQLAARLGLSKGYIARLEGGQRRIHVVEFMDVVQAIGKDASEAVRDVMLELPRLFEGGTK